MPSVLVVCLGNVCRSPAGEELLRYLARKTKIGPDLYVESCGIGSWHVGQLPSPKMQEAAKRRGLILANRAQQFQMDFFDRFDYVLAVDEEVMRVLYDYAQQPEYKAKLYLITQFSKAYKGQNIPDPYYASHAEYEQVLDMLHDACYGFLEHLSSIS
jgi:protein-tyrosine phosphatase